MPPFLHPLPNHFSPASLSSPFHGRSKKAAKHEAAAAALKSFVQFKNAFEAQQTLGPKKPAAAVLDFTSDEALLADESAKDDALLKSFDEDDDAEPQRPPPMHMAMAGPGPMMQRPPGPGVLTDDCFVPGNMPTMPAREPKAVPQLKAAQVPGDSGTSSPMEP